ncbi:hypothetical protein G7Y89_g33 [Cudoniella acicularis]|uniref:Uncharacterized protein n=1 Tax=Cudoniella acicularis TaxID=354080 RepID=A0A8H4RZ08_9HELO|nr:hypothetical protein G7Y89_g33 [Cudoniella acicularis]
MDEVGDSAAVMLTDVEGFEVPVRLPCDVELVAVLDVYDVNSEEELPLSEVELAAALKLSDVELESVEEGSANDKVVEEATALGSVEMVDAAADRLDVELAAIFVLSVVEEGAPVDSPMDAAALEEAPARLNDVPDGEGAMEENAALEEPPSDRAIAELAAAPVFTDVEESAAKDRTVEEMAVLEEVPSEEISVELAAASEFAGIEDSVAKERVVEEAALIESN